MSEELKFKIVPQYERYYSEDSNWGVYTFITEDEIPEFTEYKDPFIKEKDDWFPKKMSMLTGKMQQLYIGSEYDVVAKLEYNQKYKSFQYNPIMVTAVTPKTIEQQKKFLESLITPKQSEVLLEKYPNIVEDVINNRDDVNISKLKNIGENTWEIIREKIINNYVISDILVLLQPLGVTFKMIQKLLSETPNPSLLKQQLLDNPYIMTKIHGLGFKTVDSLALKLNPEIRISSKRTYAFLNYFLREIGENDGHTWVSINTLTNAVRDNINECMEIYNDTLNIEAQHSRMLYIENDRVSLKYCYETENAIFDILTDLNSCKTKWDIDIDSGIKEAEAEQGFELTDEQKDVVRKACSDNVVIISGKAGSGKTTITRALLKIFKNYRVRCAALSAKAAQRITEATGYPATTIHRMLGAKGFNEFEYNYECPLPAEVVMLDECSMINAELYYNVVSAINKGCKIIMSGDNRQLPPIGYGNVFSDLLEKAEYFNVFQLTKVLRQAEMSGILSDANKIREGIFPVKNPELKIVSGELQDMIYMFRDNRETLQNIAIKTYMKSIEQESLDDVVIVVPRKKDCINSTFEINKIIQDELIPESSQIVEYGKKNFKLGAKVIQRVNNYEKGVFNGEIGYITKIWDETKGKEKVIKFEVEYKLNDTIKNIVYTKGEVGQIDLAYALTVHLAQGSGYNTVIVIIDNTHYTLLDSCLLYTAITRAKKRCLLLAEASAFKKCLNNNKSITRQTWLKDCENL